VNSIYPLASLEGNNVSLTFNFNSNTLKRNISVGSNFYCQLNSTQRWIANVTSPRGLSCIIEFKDHGLSLLNISIALDVPFVSSTPIIISKNSQYHYFFSISFY
jgi:hypothetical protein